MGRKGKDIDIEQIQQLFIETGSWRAVAKALGVHPQSIKHRLEPMGYKTKQRVGRLKEWDVEEAKRLREEGKTLQEIGDLLGVSISALSRGLRGA